MKDAAAPQGKRMAGRCSGAREDCVEGLRSPERPPADWPCLAAAAARWQKLQCHEWGAPVAASLPCGTLAAAKPAHPQRQVSGLHATCSWYTRQASWAVSRVFRHVKEVRPNIHSFKQGKPETPEQTAYTCMYITERARSMLLLLCKAKQCPLCLQSIQGVPLWGKEACGGHQHTAARLGRLQE